MKKFEKIKDFIKAFFYYPKLKIYFRNRKMIEYDIWKSAIKYAWWHCNVKWPEIPESHLIIDYLCLEREKWIPVYSKEPILKDNVCYATIKIKEDYNNAST